jgi:hypothetical protein
LFGHFAGTMQLLDSSITYIPDLSALGFLRTARSHYPAGMTEVSRFSRMKFPYVLGVYDYAGSLPGSRYRLLRMLPSPCVQKVGTPNLGFRSSIPGL